MNPASPRSQTRGFAHDAFLYDGDHDFLGGTVPFIRAGLAAGEPVLVAVGAVKIELLRAALGREAGAVRFADMADVGHNPARIIPAWQQFVAENGSPERRVRGVGEPIWPGRRPAELIECQRHEALLNVAFDTTSAWSLLCPYDRTALDRTIIDETYRSHPFVRRDGTRRPSASYDAHATATAHLDAPLPEPAGPTRQMAFGPGGLTALRRLVSQHAEAAGLDTARTSDLVLAVDEIAANSLRHGGGEGLLRLWHDGDTLLCEVRDRGHIDEPLVGRRRPMPDQPGGRGLWVANQVCDLVQLRSFPSGSAVRVHMRA
jgi:anti-sigma regulatory factor (Ser/Thr protein kinase)